MMRPPVAIPNGFTLIEAMVAMAILAIATAGIIRAAEAHVDLLRGLERRASAQWVAENALAEAGAGMDAGRIGAGAGWRDAAMLAWRWQVRTRELASADRDLHQIVVEVRAPDETMPTVTLRGFVDAGTTTS
jgi:general secretion pathway protein I